MLVVVNPHRADAAHAALPVLSGADISALHGTQVFAGYGTSLADMLDHGKFGLIYTVP